MLAAHDSRRIRIGVAGWDYPDWSRIVYPARPSGGFDRVAWITRWVDLVEIDNTLYWHADPQDVGGCAVDQPTAPQSTIGLVLRFTARGGYSQISDRNSVRWFAPIAGRDARYVDRHSLAEVGALTQTARRMVDEVAELFGAKNNHIRGLALVTALEFRSLSEGRRPEAPRAIVTTHLNLSPHAVVHRDRLF